MVSHDATERALLAGFDSDLILWDPRNPREAEFQAIVAAERAAIRESEVEYCRNIARLRYQLAVLLGHGVFTIVENFVEEWDQGRPPLWLNELFS